MQRAGIAGEMAESGERVRAGLGGVSGEARSSASPWNHRAHRRGATIAQMYRHMVHPALATDPVRPAFSIAAVLSGLALSAIAIGLTTRSIGEARARGVGTPTALPAGRGISPVGSMTAPIAPAATPQAAPSPAPPVPAASTTVAQPTGASTDPLMLVFRVGGETYMRLADLTDRDVHDSALPVPRHGTLRLHRDRGDDITAAIGAVADRDVPVELQTWQGRRVEVDASCAATVVGFAVVARRVGAPGRAGGSHRTAARMLTSGHAVLAARLDRCVGSFARDAPLGERY